MNTSPWRVEWRESARRELRRLDHDLQVRVGFAVDRLVTTGQGDVRRLVNLDAEYRLRVGRWRVLFDRDEEARTLVILHVLPRGSAYD